MSAVSNTLQMLTRPFARLFGKDSDSFVIPGSDSDKTDRNFGIIATLDELIKSRSVKTDLMLGPTKNVSASGAGAYRSPFRGRGMEFEEVRIYQNGDDIRTIDWRVTARTGKPHTKVFQEERERPVHLVVDLRPRMRFGTRQAFKSVVAARAAALVGWSALSGGDRVGGIVFSAAKTVKLSPHRSRRRLLGVLNALSEGTADSSTRAGASLSEILSDTRRVARTGGLVFVFSDFYDFDDDAKRQLSLVAARSDVVCIQVFDILEQQPPPPGVYRITDGKDVMTLNAEDSEWRKAYARLFAERTERLESYCVKNRIAHIKLRTDEDIDSALWTGLRRQKRRSVSVVGEKTLAHNRESTNP